MKGSRGTGNSTDWKQFLLGLTLIVVLGAVVAYLAWASFRAFAALETQVAVAILSALTAVLIAILSAFLSRLFERRAAAEEEQQTRRIPVYEEFVSGLLKGMGATTHKDHRKPVDELAMVSLMGDFTEKALVWGSGDVLRAWLDFRAASMSLSEGTSNDAVAPLQNLEKLFLALRRDLGLSNKGLAEGDLLRLFINDLDLRSAREAKSN